jgi:hypothetical protein
MVGNPIPACGACQAALAPGATFCDHCGTARGAVPVRRERGPAPAWLARDWPLALTLTALVAVAVTAVCVAYGIGLGALGAGGDGVVPGAIVGALLPFAALGGEITAFSGNEDSSVVLLLDSVPLLLMAVAALVVRVALRPGVDKLAADPPRARALVAKVAMLGALVLLVGGGFADQGGVRTFDADAERATLTGVSQGEAAFGALLLVGLVGAVLLARAGVRVGPPLPLDLRRALLAARAGAAAYALVLLVSGLGGLLVLGAQADGVRDRFAVAASAPITLSGFGTVGSAVAHGGAAGSTDVEEGLEAAVEAADLDGSASGLGLSDLDPDDVQDCEDRSSTAREERACVQQLLRDLAAEEGGGEADERYRDALRLSGLERDGLARVSLSDWELPLTDETGTAPAWAFLSLLVPLTGLVGGTLLLLRRASPPTEGWALRLGLMLGLGYAVTAGVLAGLSPLALVATGSELDAPDFGLLLVPALGSSLGMPMLWGAVVPLATALVWSRRRGLPGNVFAGLGALPAPPAGLTSVLCPGCGTGAEPRDAFCAACGRRLRPPSDHLGPPRVVD